MLYFQIIGWNFKKLQIRKATMTQRKKTHNKAEKKRYHRERNVS